jgi:deoxyribonuclease-4
MRLGVHVSIAGGLPESAKRAELLQLTAMQIFSRSPRGGPAPKISDEDLAVFHAHLKRLGISPLAVHAPYIINLASPEDRMWEQSVRLYDDEYRRVTHLGVDFLVTHIGSTRGAEDAVGIKRVAEAINRVLANTPSSRTLILIENTAGSGQGLGARFEQIAAIRSQLRQRERVAVCLDTAHLFAAGYPIHTAAGLEETIQAFDREVGFDLLRMFHLNDSKAPFDAKVDRHWHIGYGHIGKEAFRRIINHPRLKSIPFILETPKESEVEDQHNLATVRALAQTPDKPTNMPKPDAAFAMAQKPKAAPRPAAAKRLRARR